MLNARRSRRETRYFVLRAAEGHDPEIARLSSRGSSSIFDPDSGSWINDPLLGAEIKLTEEWVPASPSDLPEALRGELAQAARAQASRSRVRRLRRFS